MVPERHTVLGAGLGKSHEGTAAIASGVAARSCVDLVAGHLKADVVLGSIAVHWDFRSLQHHQQPGLVGM